MNIYVDFDDVLCETAAYFSVLLKEMFGKDVPYKEIREFNLQKSFSLSESEYKKMMEEAHKEERLLSYDETPGAESALRKWSENRHNVQIVTGRPYHTNAASKKWLAAHGLGKIPVIHVDKYSRENPAKSDDTERSLTVAEFSRMDFDFAVEDSPGGLEHLRHLGNCRVAVFDRPWNQNFECDGKKFIRCHGWHEVTDVFEKIFSGGFEQNPHS